MQIAEPSLNLINSEDMSPLTCSSMQAGVLTPNGKYEGAIAVKGM